MGGIPGGIEGGICGGNPPPEGGIFPGPGPNPATDNIYIKLQIHVYMISFILYVQFKFVLIIQGFTSQSSIFHIYHIITIYR